MTKILNSKPVAIGFLILFATYVVNFSIPYVMYYLIGKNPAYYEIPNWWFVSYYVINLCAIVLISIKSNIVSKIGGGLFAAFWLINLADIFCLIFNHHYLYDYNPTLWYVRYLGLYLLGFLLLILSAGIWKSIKTFGAIGIVLCVTEMVLRMQIIAISEAGIYHDETLVVIDEVASFASFGFYVVTLILLIVSVCKTSKADATQKNKIDLI